MVWRDPDDEQFEEIEATWEEFSQFSKESFRFLTFSEFDQFEKASIYYYEQNVPSYSSIDRDFVPLNFLSSLFLHTHKGNKWKKKTFLPFFPNIVGSCLRWKLENVRDKKWKNLCAARKWGRNFKFVHYFIHAKS